MRDLAQGSQELPPRRSAGVSEPLAALRSVCPDGWLVGGALRDRLLGRATFDYDVVVPADGRRAARALGRACSAHSFELSEVARYLHSATVRPLLVQAMLDAPMFITRWRWVLGVSLALPRFRSGRKVAPQLAPLPQRAGGGLEAGLPAGRGARLSRVELSHVASPAGTARSRAARTAHKVALDAVS